MSTNPSAPSGSSSKPETTTSGPKVTPKVRIPASGGFGSAASSSTTAPNASSPSFTPSGASTFGAPTSSSTTATAPKTPTSAFGASTSTSSSQATPNTVTPLSGFFSTPPTFQTAPKARGIFGEQAITSSPVFGATTAIPVAQAPQTTAPSSFGGGFSAFASNPSPYAAPKVPAVSTTSQSTSATSGSTGATFGASTSSSTPATAAKATGLFGAPKASAFGTSGFGASTSASTTPQATPTTVTPLPGGGFFTSPPKAQGIFGVPATSASPAFGASTSTPTAQAAQTTATPSSGGGFSAFGSNPIPQVAPNLPASSGAFGFASTFGQTGFGSQTQDPTSQFKPFSAFGGGGGFSSINSNAFSNHGQSDNPLSLKQEIDGLNLKLACELSLGGERKKEIQSLQTQNQTLVRENDLLRRKFRATSELTRSFEKNWNAVENLLNQSGVLPYTQLITQVNRFNDAVSTTASFLSQSVVCRSPDAFQEELDRAAADVQVLMGPRLSASLTVQSTEADNGSEKPHSRLALILLQIFVLRFSISNITKVRYTSDSDSDVLKLSGSADIKTLEEFKSSFLRNLSSVMKTASWAIPVKQSRLAFEALLDSLFKAKEDLRTAVEKTFDVTDVEIMVHDHGVPFKNDSMVDAFILASMDGKEESVIDEVVGTMGVGLRKVISSSDEASSQNGLVLRAQVVLESTLQGALNGEENKPLEDLVGQEPARSGDGRA